MKLLHFEGQLVCVYGDTASDFTTGSMTRWGWEGNDSVTAHSDSREPDPEHSKDDLLFMGRTAAWVSFCFVHLWVGAGQGGSRILCNSCYGAPVF